MLFVLFIVILSAISLFHRREHVRFIAELRVLQKFLAMGSHDAETVTEKLKGQDWRLLRLEGTNAHLRRAFEVTDREGLMRYFVPLGLLISVILVLEYWQMAVLYCAVLAVKWFVTVTVLDISPARPRYEVTLFGRRLFGEPLTEVEKTS